MTSRSLFWVLVASIGSLACAANEAATSTPADDPSEGTGKTCAAAEVACDAGSCTADVQNGCKTPVTCDLHVECLCRLFSGDEGPATATSQKNTLLAGERDDLSARVMCHEGEVVATLESRVTCF